MQLAAVFDRRFTSRGAFPPFTDAVYARRKPLQLRRGSGRDFARSSYIADTANGQTFEPLWGLFRLCA